MVSGAVATRSCTPGWHRCEPGVIRDRVREAVSQRARPDALRKCPEVARSCPTTAELRSASLHSECKQYPDLLGAGPVCVAVRGSSVRNGEKLWIWMP